MMFAQKDVKTLFLKYFKKPFATSIIPTWHKTNKIVKNKIFLWILRYFSDLNNDPHEYFTFFEKHKKVKTHCKLQAFWVYFS